MVEFTPAFQADILAVHVCIPIPKSKSNYQGMRIKPWGILKLIRLNLRITSHFVEVIQMPHVSRVNCCKKRLRTIA